MPVLAYSMTTAAAVCLSPMLQFVSEEDPIIPPLDWASYIIIIDDIGIKRAKPSRKLKAYRIFESGFVSSSVCLSVGLSVCLSVSKLVANRGSRIPVAHLSSDLRLGMPHAPGLRASRSSTRLHSTTYIGDRGGKIESFSSHDSN